MRKLQGQAALEAEIARLKCLLVDIRGKIEGDIGYFPYQKSPNSNPPLPNMPGSYVVNPCNMQSIIFTKPNLSLTSATMERNLYRRIGVVWCDDWVRLRDWIRWEMIVVRFAKRWLWLRPADRWWFRGVAMEYGRRIGSGGGRDGPGRVTLFPVLEPSTSASVCDFWDSRGGDASSSNTDDVTFARGCDASPSRVRDASYFTTSPFRAMGPMGPLPCFLSLSSIKREVIPFPPSQNLARDFADCKLSCDPDFPYRVFSIRRDPYSRYPPFSWLFLFFFRGKSSDESLEVLLGPPDWWPGQLQGEPVESRFGMFLGETSRLCPDLSRGPTSGAGSGGVLSGSDFSLLDSDSSGGHYDSGSLRQCRGSDRERGTRNILDLEGDGDNNDNNNVDPPPSPKPEVRDDNVETTSGGKSCGEGRRRCKWNKSKSPKGKKKKKVHEEDEDEPEGEEPTRVDEEEDGEPVANVHSRINFNRHLLVVEQQCLQQVAFMKYLWGTVVLHFSEMWDANEALEGEVSGLKASVELVEKQLKSYKAQNKSMKTAKDKAKKSNIELRTELKKAREDLPVRTTEVEAAKKEEVATPIKKNLARHQAKWEEEKAKLVALGANLVKESFENAMAQVSLRNPGLSLDELSHEFEMLHGHICRVDTEARKLYDVRTEDEVADWGEEGEYRKGH
ncbi:hypothetical protein SESBI_46978 [Sesbania bispinosa]|nr:hypothetical protein SESBI_46978 [Sesbania bispinosa]